MRAPEYKTAVRNASSFLVYQQLRKKRQPGKYAASTNPRKNRQARRPEKFCTAAVRVEITPQTTMHAGRYIAGFPIRSKKRLEGTCIKIYLLSDIQQKNK